MDEENKIKETVNAIVSPLALAAAALVVFLSLLEFYRRGFVALFLDIRLVFAAAALLLTADLWSQTEQGRRWPSLAAAVLLVAALLPIFWKITAPYGRLGFATFAGGLAALILIVFAASRKPNL